ncbi:MAG TPA: hypothetical protein VF742_06810, partial [Terracidiphilus sp.]
MSLVSMVIRGKFLRSCLFASATAVLGLVALQPAAVLRAQTAVEAQKVAAEINRVAGNLPEESRNVITRLTLLRELPDGVWKMHTGDLSHGEAADLNESDWTPVARSS